MKQYNIYLIGNLVFIKMDNVNPTIKSESKYISGSMGGILFAGGAYTHSEIMAIYPNAKGVDSFIVLGEVWNK
jgi:hypothetical protein